MNTPQPDDTNHLKNYAIIWIAAAIVGVIIGAVIGVVEVLRALL